MKKVLVVEDEYAIRDMIALNLQMAGYETTTADSAERALEYFNQDTTGFDVAILDVMLPGMDGFSLCEYIRSANESMGIIMVTARTQEFDRIKGLGLGADDYVIKPFGINELLARVEAVYRRTHRGKSADVQEIRSGDFVLDVGARRLLKSGEPVDVTQVEFQLLEMFFQSPGTALSRERILSSVWGENYYGEVKIVDVNIRRLRVKIEDDPANPVHLVTVWGYGYRWNA